MNAQTLADFVDMGGHGLYVWAAYAMVAAGIAWEVWMLAQRLRRALDDISLQALIEQADWADS